MPDLAEKWLRQNDPDYKLKHKLDYPYLSHWGEHKIKKKEIPVEPGKIMYLSKDRNVIR